MKDILHVVGNRFPHDDVEIIGTRTALEMLQKTLNKVLSSTHSEPEAKMTTFCADGEGFDVIVELLPEKVMAEEIPPYTEEPFASR